MEEVKLDFPASETQQHSVIDMEDRNPLLSEKEFELNKEYGSLVNDSKPVRSESRYLARVYCIGIASTIVLILCLLLTPLGCVTADTIVQFKHYVWVDVLKHSHHYYPDVAANLNSSVAVIDRKLRIVLLGDSLVNRPCTLHDLKGKMQAFLSQYDYTFEIINCGFDGSKVSNMKLAPLNSCALPANPHAVILFWDTDCANIPEYLFSDEEISKMRETYVSNVNYVVTTLLETGEAFIEIWKVFLSRANNFFVMPSMYCDSNSAFFYSSM